MESRPVLVVVTGLPGSGKTTVGRNLAEDLDVAFYDKDRFLEALFDQLGCADIETRDRLGRAADEVMFRIAERTREAVLVNWWDPELAPGRLRGIGATLVEIYCDVPPEVAAERWQERRRHPGHHDHLRMTIEPAEHAARLHAAMPVPLLPEAPFIHLDTTHEVDREDLAARVREILDG